MAGFYARHCSVCRHCYGGANPLSVAALPCLQWLCHNFSLKQQSSFCPPWIMHLAGPMIKEIANYSIALGSAWRQPSLPLTTRGRSLNYKSSICTYYASAAALRIYKNIIGTCNYASGLKTAQSRVVKIWIKQLGCLKSHFWQSCETYLCWNMIRQQKSKAYFRNQRHVVPTGLTCLVNQSTNRSKP